MLPLLFQLILIIPSFSPLTPTTFPNSPASYSLITQFLNSPNIQIPNPPFPHPALLNSLTPPSPIPHSLIPHSPILKITRPLDHNLAIPHPHIAANIANAIVTTLMPRLLLQLILIIPSFIPLTPSLNEPQLPLYRMSLNYHWLEWAYIIIGSLTIPLSPPSW